MDSDDTVILVGSPAKTSTPGPKADDTPIAEGSAGQLRPKMSGAMRKRYNYWKKKGFSQEEAFNKAKEPWKIPKNPVENPKPVDKGSEEPKKAETPQVPPYRKEGAKRNRAYAKTPPEPSKRKKAEPQAQMQDRTKGPPGGASVDSVKIGIASLDYPGTKLSEEELSQMGQSVERAIAEHSEGLIKP
jgi:hypothetical protein